MIHNNLNNQPQHIRRLTYRSADGKAAATFSYNYPLPRPTPAVDEAAAKDSETGRETDNWLDKLDQMVADLERKSKEDQEALRMQQEGHDEKERLGVEESVQGNALAEATYQGVDDVVEKKDEERDWLADLENSVAQVEEEEKKRQAEMIGETESVQEELGPNEEVTATVEEETPAQPVEILAERSFLSEMDLLMPDR